MQRKISTVSLGKGDFKDSGKNLTKQTCEDEKKTLEDLVNSRTKNNNELYFYSDVRPGKKYSLDFASTDKDSSLNFNY